MIHMSVPEGKTGLGQLQPAWKVGLDDPGVSLVILGFRESCWSSPFPGGKADPTEVWKVTAALWILLNPSGVSKLLEGSGLSGHLCLCLLLGKFCMPGLPLEDQRAGMLEFGGVLPNPAEESLQTGLGAKEWHLQVSTRIPSRNKTLCCSISVCDLSLQHPRLSSHMAPNRRSGSQTCSFTALT